MLWFFSVVTHPWISFSFLFLTLFNLDTFYWHVLKFAEFSPGVSILQLNSLRDFYFFFNLRYWSYSSKISSWFLFMSSIFFWPVLSIFSPLNVNRVFLCLLEYFYNSCLKCVFDNSKLPFVFILVCLPPSICYCLIFWSFRYVFYSDFCSDTEKGIQGNVGLLHLSENQNLVTCFTLCDCEKEVRKI